MEYKFELERPHKPLLNEYDLDENKVKLLENQKKKYNNIATVILIFIFILIPAIPIYYIIENEASKFYIVLWGIGSAIITWAIFPEILKFLFKKNLNEILFNNLSNDNLKKIETDNEKYKFSLAEYVAKNKHMEQVVSRNTWEFWKSLNPTEFEETLAHIYEEKGYNATLTSATGDKGVDIFLEKDGKRIIVQCKTYKKVIGPNTARELLGTMTAMGVKEGILACPSGFSEATKRFCSSNNITLLDIDGLTKITHNFENYTPHWIANAKSIDELVTGINKNIYGRKKRRY